MMRFHNKIHIRAVLVWFVAVALWNWSGPLAGAEVTLEGWIVEQGTDDPPKDPIEVEFLFEDTVSISSEDGSFSYTLNTSLEKIRIRYKDMNESGGPDYYPDGRTVWISGPTMQVDTVGLTSTKQVSQGIVPTQRAQEQFASYVRRGPSFSFISLPEETQGHFSRLLSPLGLTPAVFDEWQSQ